MAPTDAAVGGGRLMDGPADEVGNGLSMVEEEAGDHPNISGVRLDANALERTL
ncbi:hypothetical protein GCM10010308_60540 [Streptomyces vinaceusdrappus]|nr:hypothetical protein GCM10010308_60540 [Streptomyces vinaceusdrappus]